MNPPPRASAGGFSHARQGFGSVAAGGLTGAGRMARAGRVPGALGAGSGVFSLGR